MKRVPEGFGRAGLAVVLVVAAACGGEEEDPSPETVDGDTVAGRAEAIVVPDTLAADSLASAEDPADSALPPMPGEGEPRAFRLLLVNPHEHAARVFASAGAARVALDTVPARDSALVDVRVRADRILLEAEDERGAGMGSIELDLAPDETNRWEIGPPPGPRVASSAMRESSADRPPRRGVAARL